MKLLEHTAKKILRENGVSIPSGVLINVRGPFPVVNFPVVIKAQTPYGNRKMKGLIRFAKNEAEMRESIKEIANKCPEGQRVEWVLLEEKVELSREFYLSFYLDRDQGNIRIIYGKQGGEEIENRVRNNQAVISDINIDPLIGIQKYMIRRILYDLLDDMAINDAIFRQNFTQIERLYSVFLNRGATLLEINPLGLKRNGELVAIDAKMIIDDNSLGSINRTIIHRQTDDDLESHLREFGLYGSIVNKEGNIAVITSGAGLMMATVDLITSLGGRVLLGVDLGGAVFRMQNEKEIFQRVVKAILPYSPRVVLINAFLQLANCSAFAEATVAALNSTNVHMRCVIRLRGVNEQEADRLLLKIPNVVIEKGLEGACKATLKVLEE